MKILWVTNVKLPTIFRLQDDVNQVNIGGWLDRISQGLLQRDNTELVVCYPYSKAETGTYGNLSFYGIPYDGKKMRLGRLDDISGVSEAEKILSETNPDIIHIHGSEFQYHWYFAKAAHNLGIGSKMVVSIQGLVSVYAKHFALGLPLRIKYASTIRELLGKKNVSFGIQNFIHRGEYEEKTIQLTQHVIGRTSWDRACTYRINPKAEYHVGNETLREAFYTGDWSYNKCIRHRVFISQASYPVKGFHTFIEALRDVSMFYPDVTVHVAGNDITKRDLIGGNSYGLYIKNQLEKNHLQNRVCFCGSLNEEQMKHEMLAANVFVSPSNIENSPNSVGEAMLLGVPVVSSAVGGVMDLLEHKTEGFVYQSDAPYMLAHFIMRVFENVDMSQKMGKKAQEHARVTHDYQKNMDSLVDIYNSIAKG